MVMEAIETDREYSYRITIFRRLSDKCIKIERYPYKTFDDAEKHFERAKTSIKEDAFIEPKFTGVYQIELEVWRESKDWFTWETLLETHFFKES